jgi:hypothetical protein
MTLYALAAGAAALPLPAIFRPRSQQISRTGGPDDDDGQDDDEQVAKLMPILAAVIVVAALFG